VTASAIKMAGI